MPGLSVCEAKPDTKFEDDPGLRQIMPDDLELDQYDYPPTYYESYQHNDYQQPQQPTMISELPPPKKKFYPIDSSQCHASPCTACGPWIVQSQNYKEK